MLTFAICLVIVVLTFTVGSNIFLLSERSEILNKLQKFRDRAEELSDAISNREFKADQKINAIVAFLKMQLVRPYSEITGQPYYKLETPHKVNKNPYYYSISYGDAVSIKTTFRKGGGKK